MQGIAHPWTLQLMLHALPLSCRALATVTCQSSSGPGPLISVQYDTCPRLSV